MQKRAEAFPQTPFHAVAHHGVANLPAYGKANLEPRPPGVQEHDIFAGRALSPPVYILELFVFLKTVCTLQAKTFVSGGITATLGKAA
jgi:hypothetical protein